MSDSTTTIKLPPILGISGKKYSGKTSCALIIKDIILPKAKVQIISFADALKDEVVEAVKSSRPSFTREEMENYKEKWRWLLQGWGTEYRREQAKDYWIHKLMDNIELDANLIVIPDVRFYNELDWIKSNGGEVIYINRPNITHSDKHSSEAKVNDEYFRKQCLVLDNMFSIGLLPSLLNDLWIKNNLKYKLKLNTIIKSGE